MLVRSEQYWDLFMMSGAPELYLLYSSAKRAEEENVFDDSGPGPACNSIQ